MTSWFRQYWSISRTAFVVTLGTPFSLVLILSILGFLAILGAVPAFTFGEQLRLIRDQSLALSFIGGCLAASLGAAKVIADDLRRGPAPVIFSRPVSGFGFIAGKWTGIVGSLLVIQAAAAVGTLWLTRITQHEEAFDSFGLGIFLGSIVLALALVAVKQYFLGGCYVWQANLAIVVIVSAAFLLSLATGHDTGLERVVDWKTAQGSLMIAFGLLLYTGIVSLLAVVMDTGLLLGLSVALFFFGLLSDYLLTSVAVWQPLRMTGRMLLPRWQLFWIGDQLGQGVTVPWSHVWLTGVYALLYAACAVVAAAMLLNRREMKV